MQVAEQTSFHFTWACRYLRALWNRGLDGRCEIFLAQEPGNDVEVILQLQPAQDELYSIVAAWAFVPFCVDTKHNQLQLISDSRNCGAWVVISHPKECGSQKCFFPPTSGQRVQGMQEPMPTEAPRSSSCFEKAERGPDVIFDIWAQSRGH